MFSDGIAAVFGKVRGYRPKAGSFSLTFSPDEHRRLRGPLSCTAPDDPSTTVTSHISKDGPEPNGSRGSKVANVP